jgi:hypothetical protein
MAPEPDAGANHHIKRKSKKQASGYTAGPSLRGLRECLPVAEFNRQSPASTQAEASSMTLSMPNATSSRLCAAMPAPIATAPSMTIHAIESHSKEKALRISLARLGGMGNALRCLHSKATFGFSPERGHSWRAA